MSDRLLRVWEALHVECGVEAIAPTMEDQHRLSEFMQQMQGLDATSRGPLCPSDIRAVVGFMRHENHTKDKHWAIRPNAILDRPQQFRDLVLAERSKGRAKPRKYFTPEARPEVDPGQADAFQTLKTTLRARPSSPL